MKKQWVIFILKSQADSADLLFSDPSNSDASETIWLRLYNAQGAQNRYDTEEEAWAAASLLLPGKLYTVLPVAITQVNTITLPACGLNHTSVSITDTTNTNFVIEWTEAAQNFDTIVKYRVQGSGTWLLPNTTGNATGVLVYQKFVFTAGLTVGVHYEVLIQNICLNGQISAGVVVDAIATDSGGPL